MLPSKSKSSGYGPTIYYRKLKDTTEYYKKTVEESEYWSSENGDTITIEYVNKSLIWKSTNGFHIEEK
jgi:hypothetical protein